MAKRARCCPASLSARLVFISHCGPVHKVSSSSTLVGNSLHRSDETHAEGKQTPRKGLQASDGSPRVEAVSSVSWCVWALKAQISSGALVSQAEGASGAAEVVYDQRDVKTVHLQQVDQEGAITLGIQPHGPHVLSSEGGIDAPCYLRQGLEDAVIQLHEEPRTGLKTAASGCGPWHLITTIKPTEQYYCL